MLAPKALKHVLDILSTSIYNRLATDFKTNPDYQNRIGNLNGELSPVRVLCPGVQAIFSASGSRTCYYCTLIHSARCHATSLILASDFFQKARFCTRGSNGARLGMGTLHSQAASINRNVSNSWNLSERWKGGLGGKAI
jgi:hypothetical protein